MPMIVSPRTNPQTGLVISERRLISAATKNPEAQRDLLHNAFKNRPIVRQTTHKLDGPKNRLIRITGWLVAQVNNL